MSPSFDYLAWADRNWALLRRVVSGHAAVYRATHGLVGHRLPGVPPTLLLEQVGAKSGRPRTSMLFYTRDGENLVLVASKGGHPRNPAWFHNLRAHPDTVVQVGSRRVAVHAHVADAGERERLWPKVVAVYGGYETYRRRAGREIPLVVLEPR
jgi:F420H(2)-dependent quinone reductase